MIILLEEVQCDYLRLYSGNTILFYGAVLADRQHYLQTKLLALSLQVDPNSKRHKSIDTTLICITAVLIMLAV